MSRRLIGALIVIVSAALFHVCAQGPTNLKDWPQWRGPERTNVSPDTRLLKEWPEAGPPLLWKADGLGQGVASVAIAGGKVYTLGYQNDDEYVTAINVKDGKLEWKVRIGPAVKEDSLMRWLSQRTPTVDGELMYAFTAAGTLVCLETSKGKERWRKDYVKDFDAKRPVFGFCDYPLVDGDKLICTPGAEKAGMAALNKVTGEVIWQTAISEQERASYCTTVAADVGGVRQYINSLSKGLISVAAADGKVLWRYHGLTATNANTGAPIVRDNLIFYVNGYSAGGGLLRLTRADGIFKVEEVWRTKESLSPWMGSAILVGDHVYFLRGKGFKGSGPICLEFATGKLVGEPTDLDLGTSGLTYADGCLYLRSNNGKASLISIAPTGAKLRGSFDPPRPPGNNPGGVFPVVVDGRLYLRNMDLLLCYDVKDPNAPRGPNPIFVPSPQDVVEKMLELANVTKDDVVYDLGCGDGRIVITAAKKYGCKAVGLDIDPECVKMALENVKENKVEHLVRIDRKNLYGADLSGASVVTLYLLPSVNIQLIPQLEKLKPGSRIVSHVFDMKGVHPDRIVKMTSQEDGLERPLYLWTTPLKLVKAKREQ